MKKTKTRLYLCLAAVLTLLPGCDLLFDKPEGDLMKDVAEAVGMVTTDVSNQKVGYSFEVQATANPDYGFVGWVALRSADWEALPAQGQEAYVRDKAAASPGLAAITNAVNTGGALTGAASVTVLTGEAIVLAPFCVMRPSVDYTSPAKGEVNVSYARPVQINFTSPVARILSGGWKGKFLRRGRSSRIFP